MRFVLAAVMVLVPLAAMGGDRDEVVERWNERMTDTAAQLKAQDYRRALKLANRTVAEMVDRLGPGHASTELFGIVLTYKALAHAGLNENDEALWYWHIVLDLYPKVAENDLTMFGAPGEFLKQNLDRMPPPMTSSAGEGTFVPPKLLKKVKPKYPHGAHYFGTSGELVVEVMVAPDGRVRSPTIQKALPAPTLSYAALEALRRWKFEPARAGGTAVPYHFNLTINYKE